MKGRREDPWPYNKCRIKNQKKKRQNLSGDTGDMEFYRFPAERSIYMEIFEGFCIWANLEENEILQLFVFPGIIHPPETDCDLQTAFL